MTRSIVVVGTDMASLGFVSELVARSSGLDRLTVVDEKLKLPTNKVLVQSFLAGKRDADETLFHSEQWFEKHNVSLMLGCSVTMVDQEEKAILLSSGEVLYFDEILISPSRKLSAPAASEDAEEFISSLETVADLKRIDSQLKTSHKVVVMGGGFAGIESSLSIKARGIDVELITESAQLLRDVLDPVHAKLLKLRIEKAGILVRTLSEIVSVSLAGAETDGVLVLSLKNGDKTHCDMVIVTDETADFDAEWEQGSWLARLYLGEVNLRPANYELHNISSPLFNVAIYSSGSDNQEENEIIELDNRLRGTFTRFEVRQGNLVGAILIGDDRAIERLSFALATRLPLVDAAHILFGRQDAKTSASFVSDADIVCMCNGVTKQRIFEAALGAVSPISSLCMSKIVSETRATTGCGGCREMVVSVVEEILCGQPPPEEARIPQLVTVGN